MGSAPAISVERHQDRGIRVVCRSSGWYPQPKAQWRGLQRKLLASASEEITPKANGLFQTEIAILLTEESNQKMSCCVRNPRLNQERESVISIAEPFFPRVNPLKVALWVILTLLAVLMALAGYCFWRRDRATEILRSDMESEKGHWRHKHCLQTGFTEFRDKREEGDGAAVRGLGLARARGYAVDVTLDPDTANPNLVLS
ncbi:unnamed protein product, partial [Eretmochelys imbricata]